LSLLQTIISAKVANQLKVHMANLNVKLSVFTKTLPVPELAGKQVADCEGTELYFGVSIE